METNEILGREINMTVDCALLNNTLQLLGNKSERSKQEELTYNQALETIQRLFQLQAKKLEEVLFESKSNSN